MKIVILDGYASNPGDLSWDKFRALGELTVYDRTPPELVAERMEDADIVVLNKVTITEELLDNCHKLKIIAILATGYNMIDLGATARRGITVCYVPAYSTDSVAQHTFALLLEVCVRAGDHSASVHSGDWVNANDYCYWKWPLIELSGKTLGIIGFGNIGQKVAGIAASFGMKIVYYSRTRYEHLENEAVSYRELDELLAVSDVISLHCPLTSETEGLINIDAISKMKNGAIIINTTRGAVLDEDAVARALNSGKLYAAGLDVLSTEPPSGDNPLLSAKNCIITPHIAWAPKESRARLIDVTHDNIRLYLEGRPQNVVPKLN